MFKWKWKKTTKNIQGAQIVCVKYIGCSRDFNAVVHSFEY